MKRNNSVFVPWQAVVLALAVIAAAAALPAPAYCQTDGTALLLQQTPPQAGNITPAPGVHKFEPYTQVTLTAVPKPGYQFVYWLGDVSEPTASTTVAYLDAPKIIIAVFERVKHEFLPVKERIQSAPMGGLLPSPGDYARRGGGGAGGRRPRKWRWPSRPPEPEPEKEDFPVPQQDFPVPQEEQDFPVPQPIPEPATIMLLSLGSLALLRKRKA